MHQSPRIKPTLINSGYATPKAVENRRAKAAAKWNQAGSADLGAGPAGPALCQVGPSFGWLSSRVFYSLLELESVYNSIFFPSSFISLSLFLITPAETQIHQNYGILSV
jgi:hypothetical protein